MLQESVVVLGARWNVRFSPRERFRSSPARPQAVAAVDFSPTQNTSVCETGPELSFPSAAPPFLIR